MSALFRHYNSEECWEQLNGQPVAIVHSSTKVLRIWISLPLSKRLGQLLFISQYQVFLLMKYKDM